jgi:hypothetical protein
MAASNSFSSLLHGAASSMSALRAPVLVLIRSLRIAAALYPMTAMLKPSP